MTNTAGETNVKPWTPDTAQFGTRLAMVRQRMGWNLTEASIKCGLGQNDWARYEDGRSPRRLDEVVAKIADSTGVDRAWLMWGTPGGGNAFIGIRPLHRPFVGRTGLEPVTGGSWVAPVTPIRERAS